MCARTSKVGNECDFKACAIKFSDPIRASPNVYEDDLNNIKLDELPNVKIGDKFRCVRDGVTKSGTLVNLFLDPSRTQISCAFRCAGNEVL